MPSHSDAERFDKQMADLKAKMTEWHAAIGRLMLRWAETETLLYRVLLHYGGLSDEVGRALLSGTRMKGLMEFLLSVAHNTGMDSAREGDLKCVAAQLTTINTMRDRLAHSGMWAFSAVDGKDEQPITNLERSSRGEHNGYFVMLGADGIDAMITDLGTIGQHLSRHLQEEFQPYRPPADASTWLYRSPQPIPVRGRTGRADRK